MPETNIILKIIESIVDLWISNTPKFMQPELGWEIYERIANALA